MFRFLVVVIGALVLSGNARSDVFRNDRFSSGNWSGAAYDNDAREFNSCGMYASYKNGISLHFTLFRDWRWWIGFQSQDWNLQAGKSYPITYWIDGYAVRSASAKALATNLAAVVMPDDFQLFTQFRRGLLLTVLSEGHTFKFHLEGTSAALQELASCVSRHTRQTSATSPFVAQNAPRASATAIVSAEQRLEATKVIANILAQRQMTGFQLLTAADLRSRDVPNLIKNAEVSWIGPKVIGILRIVPRSAARDAAQIAALMIGDDAQSCKGSFASGAVSDDAAEIRRVYVACAPSNGVNYYIYYTIVPLADGTFYNIAHFSFEQPDSAQAAEENVRQAVFSVLRK